MKLMLANVAIAEKDDDFAVNCLGKIWKRNLTGKDKDTEIYRSSVTGELQVWRASVIRQLIC